MKKKVLFIATIASHINSFHQPDLLFFMNNGWEVHVVVGIDPEIRGDKVVTLCDKFYVIPITRSPFKWSNIVAFRQLKGLISQEKYNIIHCHNPMGGVIARLAAMKARNKIGTKVIYTCHGAHFYTGAPLHNWLVYYPIEKILSSITDCIITINMEDYHRISSQFRKCKVEYIPGVGFGEKFHSISACEKLQLKKQYGYSDKDFILMFVGELNKGKNQGFLIDVIDLLKDEIPELRLILVGKGNEESQYKVQTHELGLKSKVDFWGYRTDVHLLLQIADIYVAASKREGLAVNVLEALGSGLPVVTTKTRGQSDLISNGINGFVIEPGNTSEFACKIRYFYNNKDQIHRFSMAATESARPYRDTVVRGILEAIYRGYMA